VQHLAAFTEVGADDPEEQLGEDYDETGDAPPEGVRS